MVKITYDLNNKNECKLIFDYYFFKCYSKCLYNDWINVYLSNKTNKSIIIIKNNVNKIELKKFLSIYRKLIHHEYFDNDLYISDNSILIDLFQRGYKEMIKIYKSYLNYIFNGTF